MIAKIIKGTNFSGVLSYMLNKCEGKVKVLQANGVRSSFPYDIAHDFNLQASMRPSVQKPVCHTILSFSAHDTERLTDDVMVKIANEYIEKNGLRRYAEPYRKAQRSPASASSHLYQPHW